MNTLTYRSHLGKAFSKRYINHTDFWSSEKELTLTTTTLLKYLLKPAHILDLGAGCGRDSVFFLTAGHRVTALDLYEHPAWKGLLAQWKGLLSFKKRSFQEWESHTLFDAVLDNGCFHHQHPSDYQAYLLKLRQVLKPLGIFALCIFAKEDQGDKKIQIKKIEDGRLCRYFAETELKQLLNFYGFELLESQLVYRSRLKQHYLIAITRGKL